MNHWVNMLLSMVAHFQTTNIPHTCDCASSTTIKETVRLSASCLVSHCWSPVFKLCYLILHQQWNILFLVTLLEQTNQRPSQSLHQLLNPKLDTVSWSKGYKIFTKIQCLHVFCSLTSYFPHIFTFAVSCARWYNFLFLAPLCVEPLYPVCTC